MAKYRLHCFCQSGNSYKVALYLNCAGLDWEPVFVDFFNGADARCQVARERQRDGRGARAGMVAESSAQSGVILTYLAELTDQFAAADEDERIETLRWILFDNHKFTELLRHLPVPEVAGTAGARSPDVLAFLKGRLDGAAAIVEKHLGHVDVHGRRARPRSPTSRSWATCSIPSRNTGYDWAKSHPNISRLDWAPARTAGLEGPLRADAGRAHQAAQVRTSQCRSRRG